MLEFFSASIGKADKVLSQSPDSRCISSHVFLPIVSNNAVVYFEDPYEDEVNGNDSPQTANGFLRSGKVYYGKPDDEFDFFSIYLREPGTVTVDVPDPHVTGGQLILYSDSAYPVYISPIDNSPLDGYHVEYPNLQVGLYYILVFVDTSRPHESTQYYSLTVTYPVPTIPHVERYVVEFNGEKIYSDRTEDEASTDPIYTTIPPGTYKITLASYDDHSDQTAPEQPAEKWRLLFYNQNNVLVGKSDSTGDLPTNIDCIEQVVDTAFTLEQTVRSVAAFHSAYPNSGSPNSVIPDYAILETISGSRLDDPKE